MGMDPAVLRANRTAELIAENSRWEYHDLPYWDGEVDVCINAWTLANGGWLGVDVSKLARWFPEHQMADGGWNCEWVDGSKRSSFHSTLNAVKGLLAYDVATGGTDETHAARRAGEEYLLERRLLYRLSTGEQVASWVDHFAYPMRWHYSAINAVDYFREAAIVDDIPPDPRLADAVERIRAARQPDGTWLQDGRLPGDMWFEVDVPAGNLEMADAVRHQDSVLVGLRTVLTGPCDAEANVVHPERRMAPAAYRHADAPVFVGPAAALEDAVLAVDRRVVEIPAPVPGVAEQIVSTPGVGKLLAGWMQPTAGVPFIPGDLVQNAVPRPRCPRGRRVPIRLR